MENQDRELLELAAKAAGIELTLMEVKNVSHVGDDRFIGYMVSAEKWPRGWFNPLVNDGDALRLAASLGIHIAFYGDHIAVQQTKTKLITAQAKNGDMFSATRRAIVRAAAEIGKGME